MKTEKIGADLKKHIENTIESTAENHLEAWADRYKKYNKVSDVRFDLKMNHDSSLEIEHAEEQLGRKLNERETEFLIDRFNVEVCKKCKNFINKDY